MEYSELYVAVVLFAAIIYASVTGGFDEDE